MDWRYCAYNDGGGDRIIFEPNKLPRERPRKAKEYIVSTAQTNVIDFPRPFLSLDDWKNGKAYNLEMRDPEVVTEFLEENQYLLPVIDEACEKLVEYFGMETSLVLKLVYPKDGGRSELFLYVQTNLPVSEARRTLDRFDEEWWLDEMPRSQFRMVVTLGYA